MIDKLFRPNMLFTRVTSKHATNAKGTAFKSLIRLTHGRTKVHHGSAFTLTENVLTVVLFSGWLEAIFCGNQSTDSVIKVLVITVIFARFGIPQTVVLDKASKFQIIVDPHFDVIFDRVSTPFQWIDRVYDDSSQNGLTFFNASNVPTSNASSCGHILFFVHRNSGVRHGKTPVT